MTASSVLFQSLSLRDLPRLGNAVPPAISLLLPGYAPGGLARPHSLCVKNAIDSIFHQLLARDWSHHEIAHLVAPLLYFSHDPSFHEGRKTGIAFFLDRQGFFCFDIPGETPESLTLASHFHIRPLLPWLTQVRDFLILELAQERIALIRCSNSKLSAVPLPRGVPSSIEEISLLDPPPSGHNPAHRALPGRAPSYPSPISFGLSSADEGRRIQFFCSMLDRGLHSLLQEFGLPLVLAGSDRVVRCYRNENTYPNTISSPIRAGIELLSHDQIILRARQLITEERAQEAARHLSEMEEYAPGDRWSTSLPDILRGAVDGRISRLFLSNDAVFIGDFEDTLKRPLHGLPLQEDLINAMALETLIHTGEVLLVEPHHLPAQSSAAALFRYSLDSDNKP